MRHFTSVKQLGDLSKALEEKGISPLKRAEALTLNELCALSDAVLEIL